MKTKMEQRGKGFSVADRTDGTIWYTEEEEEEEMRRKLRLRNGTAGKLLYRPS